MNDERDLVAGDSLLGQLRKHFFKIRVYALVGKSGTGKSFRAKLVAEKYGINYIIDDGLLIHDNSIVAGKSAKREKIYITAVKTALFDDPLHRHEVIKAIESRKIKKILLIGTSKRMVNQTAERLNLTLPFKYIMIEEISSKEEIEKALDSRNNEGKHVIPVPSIQVERDYPQLISKSIKILFKIGRSRKGSQKVYEKSVVQPLFHQNQKNGGVSISEKALGQMIAHCADEYDSQIVIKRVRIRTNSGSYHIRTEITVPYGHELSSKLYELRNYIVSRIEKYTNIIIGEFDIVISDVRH